MKKLTTFTAIIAAILIFSSCTKIKPNKNIYTSNNNHNSTKIYKQRIHGVIETR